MPTEPEPWPEDLMVDFPNPAPDFPAPPRPGLTRVAVPLAVALLLLIGGPIGFFVTVDPDAPALAIACFVGFAVGGIATPFAGAAYKRHMTWRHGRILPARVIVPGHSDLGGKAAGVGMRSLGLGGGLMASAMGVQDGSSSPRVEFVLEGQVHMLDVPEEGDAAHWGIGQFVWIVIHKTVLPL